MLIGPLYDWPPLTDAYMAALAQGVDRMILAEAVTKEVGMKKDTLIRARYLATFIREHSGTEMVFAEAAELCKLLDNATAGEEERAEMRGNKVEILIPPGYVLRRVEFEPRPPGHVQMFPDKEKVKP